MHRKILPVLAACLAALDSVAFASGSAINRLPVPTAAGVAAALDREKFGLGQKIFSGSVAPSGHEAVAPQRARLVSLQSKLPEGVVGKKDLTQFAGHLLPSQLDALEYFITQRYLAR